MNQRIAIVTGGIGGLGTAICIALAQAGRRVVAADLSARTARIADFRRETEGLDIRFEPVDVTDFASCGALARKVEAELGAVDILVNAAGITRDTTLRKMEPSQWDAVMRVNLDSVFNLSRHVIDGMTTRGFGRIVNISSVNGQTGQFGQANYSAAKAGMHGFTISLARENAKLGITVNTVSPGYVATDMVMAVPEEVRAKIVADIPTGRLGKPEEIAYAVGFLVSDEAAWITGSNLDINGGGLFS